jgi:hypothetical protein
MLLHNSLILLSDLATRIVMIIIVIIIPQQVESITLSHHISLELYTRLSADEALQALFLPCAGEGSAGEGAEGAEELSLAFWLGEKTCQTVSTRCCRMDSRAGRADTGIWAMSCGTWGEP